ncbi:MAG: hypothetical protein JWO95_1145 [Verrucomicrobiales bacterium]|nr:hypothetical protein [Verrucomicrobiales bacterium]
MKKLITIGFAAVLFVGCKSSYDVTLNNGSQYTSVSKPKLDPDRGVYIFKNMSGKSYTVPETRVRTIEPHTKRDPKFRNQSDSEFKSSGR